MITATFKEKQNLNKLSQAIKSRSVVRFEYKEEKRIVEPFLVGVHKDSDDLSLRCWCKTRNTWRLFKLQEMELTSVAIDSFDPSKRKGYNRNDSDMSEIIVRIE